MRRKVLVLVLAALLLSLAIAVLLLPPAAQQRQRYNAVDVYVLGWDLNTTDVARAVDVRFVISIDTDGDGAFDLVRSSAVLNSTIVESAPFRSGAAMPVEAREFYFQVRAERVLADGTAALLYTSDGTVPLNKGYNDPALPLAWSFDGTALGQENGCRISYGYVVAPS